MKIGRSGRIWPAAFGGVAFGAMAVGCSAAGEPSLGASDPSAATAGPLEARIEYGEAVYGGHCVECHGPDLGGGMGSSLRGTRFLGPWIGKPVSELADRILYTMPATAPGSLDETEAADVALYLLRRNGSPLPAGGIDRLLANPIAEGNEK